VTYDYTRYPLAYKLRKVARYIRLYGPARTLIKVRSQYHMRSPEERLVHAWNNSQAPRDHRGDIGIIGCGNFAYSTIAYYANRNRHGSILATFDPVGARSVSLCRAYNGAYAAADADTLIADPRISTVFVASNHASHAEYAIRAIEAGKRVHIEKPHVVNDDQLERLMSAVLRGTGCPVFLGFNRPRSGHFARILSWLAEESGPLMINWFIAGHEISDDHWYFSEEEGGRILGNLCHWTDLSARLVGLDRAFPVIVNPGSVSTSKSDFALSFDFADGSVASITFSAKGHAFDGVREYLNIHRGSSLISMQDFHESILHRGSSRAHYRSLYRDHGHRANIVNSLRATHGESLHTIAMSARLFLAAKRANDSKQSVRVEGATFE
jgi:predicted dehydrogenase